MKIICRENCSGKTKELIRESLDTGVPILALTSRKEASLKEKSMAYFNEIVNVIGYEDAKDYNGSVLIDDIEQVLTTLVRSTFDNSNISVAGLTLSA